MLEDTGATSPMDTYAEKARAIINRIVTRIVKYMLEAQKQEI